MHTPGVPILVVMRTAENLRRRVLVVAVVVAVSGTLAGCQTEGERLRDQAEADAPIESDGPAASVAEISVTPLPGAADVAPDQPVTVTAVSGQLTAVVVVGPSGVVSGALGADRATWTSTGLLGIGASYAITATAVDPNGLEETMRSSFTTMTPAVENTVDVSMSPLEGETVGVGMPVVLYFSDPVEDDRRGAVEEQVAVVSTPAVEGAWHWIDAEELHWRPRELWPAGTEVTVDLDIEGVRAGAELWGGKREVPSRDFSVTDKATTSVVNLAEKSLKVYQDEALVRTIPITGGKPGWETRNGTKVILEKHRDIVMDGDSVGIDPGDPEYYRLDVEYALRVTWSGEFLHSAPWSQGAQGEDLVSHGCVGMSEADAAWMFDLTTRGDIVTVTGSPRPLEKGNGYTDWNYPWEEWIAGSALATTPTPTATP